MVRRSPPLGPLLLVALAAGCAAPAPYPSLEVRPAELEHAEDREERRPTPLPDDPALASELARLTEQARRGAAEFEAALPAAQRAVARAGARGSDSWMEAQQAVSRAEAARAVTTGALAELDRLAIGRAAAGTTSAADLERLRGAVATVQALADAQADRLRRLQAALS